MKSYLSKVLAILVALFGITASEAMAWHNTFGAIAISPSTGARGTTWGRWNVLDAQLGARIDCGFADCFVAVTVNNSCASVAMGFGGVHGWAIRGNGFLAAQAALMNCAVRTSNCFTSATVCSY